MDYEDLDLSSLEVRSKAFQELPRWKRELWLYEFQQMYKPKKITLPSIDASLSISNLPKPNKKKSRQSPNRKNDSIDLIYNN